MSERLPLRLTNEPGEDLTASPAPGSALIDTFGRVHNNLRISVTDRCNLRCTYCMPEDVTFLDRSELLTFEEIAGVRAGGGPLGVDKIRLTGGEPLMRRDLHRLVRMLVHARHPRRRPDHQRHPARRSGGACSLPACGGSTSGWIRSTRARFRELSPPRRAGEGPGRDSSPRSGPASSRSR